MKQAVGLILLAIIFSFSGCAKPVHVRSEDVVGPNGRPAIAMRCGNMAACFKEAGERCPNGYERLYENTLTRGGPIYGGYGGGVSTRGSMLIQCKE
jgi:hypothetical protein